MGATEQNNNMSCNIYTCTSCGAQLLVNGVEASTYCAYCGQPTIVLERVSEELRPKYIIPFKITKDEAETLIRKRFAKAFFAPKEVKNFRVEQLRGIYIPYWLYDFYYYDRQRWEKRNDTQKADSRSYIYTKEAECDFKNLTVEGSKMLDNELSQRLEPYDLTALRPFEIGYLSGFYADRFDQSEKQLRGLAIGRCKELFNKAVRKSIIDPSVELTYSRPKYEFKKAEYAFLPAWFMTFRYRNKPHTILVNGQTGKVVGTAPFDIKKAALCFVVALVLSLALFMGLCLLTMDSVLIVGVWGILFVLTVVSIVCSIVFFKKIRKNEKRTKQTQAAHYVKERQEDN